MKVLIAVVTCRRYSARAQAQRDTWVRDLAGADLRFFVGRGPTALPDEVALDCGDSYEELPHKVKAMCAWAAERGYDFVYKCDDDSYVRPERLLASGFEPYDYSGRLRGPSGGKPSAYCSGFGYWLSAKAMRIVAAAQPNDKAEDRFVGNVLLEHGIQGSPDYRHVVLKSNRSAVSSEEGPRKGNDLIASCEHNTTAAMAEAHEEFLHKPARVAYSLEVGPLNRVSILVKTFLRDGYLARSLKSIQSELPDAQIIVVDDGREARDKIRAYSKLRALGHKTIWLPFDSGFGAKSNAGSEALEREFMLVGSDDFDFAGSRPGIEAMLEVLDLDPSIGVASGRVGGRPYEALLRIEGRKCVEVPGYREELSTPNGTEYKLCDLTVNYSLIRREVLASVRWDGDVKIGGGEHGAFFIDVMRGGWKTAYVPAANVREFPHVSLWMDPRYPGYRGRAKAKGRPCLKKRGIDTYEFAGQVEEA